MQSLPIDALLPRVLESLRAGPNLVIEAPPGAGKTTRVPSALLDADAAGGGEVWVLEPRRLAARLAARRVAEERGEQLGETVGYQVRFEEVAGPRTRLRFLTEGVLTRRLLSDPRLGRVGSVVLDEFHERHLQADLALALLRRLQRQARPDLKIVAMSATLEAAPVARYLGGCAVLRSEGRRFDVSVEHLARPDERPLASQVEAAVRRLVAEGLDGDVLVFLPGAAEIRRAQEACARVAGESDLLVVALHGELPAAEQDRAVRPAGRRKVILSTNVAETSVTIEGVVAVIDSGLARVASHSPWSGLPTLNVGRVSQASAAQRAGRAGRTRPGRCLRLYTAQDFNARPAHEAPEVERLDLAEPALELHANGVENLRAFGWFEAPPAHALDAAETLLQKLGALDAAGRVTETGRAMLRLPVHPRLARLVVEGERRGVGSAARVVAALVGERDIREREVLSDAASRGPARARRHGPSDLLELLDLFREAARLRFAPERLRASGVNPTAARNVERVARQLRRLTRDGARSGGGGEQAKEDRREQTQGARAEPKEDRRVPSKVERGGSSFRLEPSGESSAVEALSEAGEAELLISILAGYPDRVARRRASNEGEGGRVELLLAGGGSAQLAPESVVRQSEFMVAVDAEQRRDAGGRKPVGRGAGGTLVRLASACEPEWLLDLFPESVGESIEARWNAQAERVEVLSRLVYEGLVLAESRANEAGGAEAARLLAEAALAAGPGAFADADALERFLARVEFAARTFPEADFPRLEDEDVRAALVELCEGRRSFAELREAARAGTLFDALRRKLNAEQTRLLASGAPERVTLGGGRQVRVNYERERPPWVASRLQDFFGMDAGPRVGAGRVPLLLHLLAPNQRPVQLTSDLAGFWQRHYPQVRRELSRRYPRHAWPEDPLKPETSEGGKKR